MRAKTYKDIENLRLYERFSKNYNLTEGAVKQIIIQLETDWTLGHWKYARMSRRIAEMFNLQVTPRQVRYMHKMVRNANILSKKLKKGNRIESTFQKLLYQKS